MAPWRFLLMFALAFGSVLPHCAAAAPAAATASHDVSMGEDHHAPGKAQVSDACIGCAVPVRFALAAPVEPTVATCRYVDVRSTLATRVTVIDPPPPRTRG